MSDRFQPIGHLFGVLGLLATAGAALARDGAEFADFRAAAAPPTAQALSQRPPPQPWPGDAPPPRVPTWAERTAFGLAAAGDWPGLLAAVRANRLPASASDEEGRTLLALASAAGQAELVQALVARGAELEARAPAGESPLQQAVLAGHAQVVRALLKAGADPHSPGGADQPPLHRAARLGLPGVLRALLEGGADPLWPDTRGRPALTVAFLAGQFEALDALNPATRAARERLQRAATAPVLPIPFRR